MGLVESLVSSLAYGLASGLVEVEGGAIARLGPGSWNMLHAFDFSDGTSNDQQGGSNWVGAGSGASPTISGGTCVCDSDNYLSGATSFGFTNQDWAFVVRFRTHTSNPAAFSHVLLGNSQDTRVRWDSTTAITVDLADVRVNIAGDFSVGVWNTLAVSYDSATSTVTAYLNGALADEQTGTPAPSSGSFVAGQGNFELDYIYFFDTELSGAEMEWFGDGSTSVNLSDIITAWGAGTESESPTFAWDMESDTPNIYAGDGTPDYQFGIARYSGDAHTGTYCLRSDPAQQFSQCVFNGADPSPDFDHVEGTIEMWVKQVGTYDQGMQLFNIKADNSHGIRASFSSVTIGAIKIQRFDGVGFTEAECGGFTADTWHKVVLKWRETASNGVYLYVRVDDRYAAKGTSAPTPSALLADTFSPGTDTSDMMDVRWDEIKIYQSWQEDL